MGEFHSTDGGFTSMTKAELDRVARENAGKLTCIGYGYATRRRTTDTRHGYKMTWIATGGMGNCGCAVLIGVSKGAKYNLRIGKIRMLEDEHDLNHAEAQRLYDALKTVNKGMERAVVKQVLRVCSSGKLQIYWGLMNFGSINRWAEVFDTSNGMSVPRMIAVSEVLGNLELPLMQSARKAYREIRDEISVPYTGHRYSKLAIHLRNKLHGSKEVKLEEFPSKIKEWVNEFAKKGDYIARMYGDNYGYRPTNEEAKFRPFKALLGLM